MTPPITQELCMVRNVMIYDNDTGRFPVRKHPRLKEYDYTTENYYFVTLCTRNKERLFGDAENLSPIGKTAESCLREIPKHFCNVVLDKYVVMPNHIHAIVILPGKTANLSVVIGQYKAAVTKQLHKTFPKLSLWQTSFHDHVIRSQEDYERIWAYIEGNPSKWTEDCFYMP